MRLGLGLKFDPTNVVSALNIRIFYFCEYYRFLLTGWLEVTRHNNYLSKVVLILDRAYVCNVFVGILLLLR